MSPGAGGAAAWKRAFEGLHGIQPTSASTSGLDTLPSLAVVLLGLSVLMGDVVLALAGLVTGVAGVALTTLLGNLAARAVGELF